MADFTPDIAEEVVAACTAGAEEAAEAFTRTFDQEATFSTGEASTLDLAALPEGFDGPGLAVMMQVGESGAVALLPEASGLIPEWYADPDPTGKSKLTTLAQEFGMILLPEEHMPEDFRAGRVSNLSEALQRAGAVDGAGLVPITITGGEKTGEMTLVWPLAKPTEVMEPEPEPEQAAEEPPTADSPAPPEAANVAPAPGYSLNLPVSFEEGLSQLPSYARSLLKIKVPITVTLAVKRQPVSSILDLGPGSIIQFEKSCEEMLELEVNNQKVGLGEAVKVGDKFGLRLTSVILPGERFETIQGKKSKAS